MPDNIHDWPHPPAVDKRRRLSLVWLVPLVAALIGVSMLMRTWLSVGPQITLTFQSATGLEAGKTPVKYKDVTVGSVSSITLSDDRSHVLVTASLAESAESLAREDTRFWVVRPRIGARGISGVDTLLSGAYIGVDTGASTKPATTFTGLESPPTVISGMPGKIFTVRTSQLNSLDIDSPVYYRDVKVGRVVSYQLDSDGKGVSLQVFIDEPYDRFVTTDTRFWNASGVDFSLGAEGLKVKTQSMAAIVAGGIAFSSPEGSRAEPATARSPFSLAQDQKSAMAQPDGPAHYIQLRFEQSLRGLTVGAPVEFSSVTVGRVVSMELDYDASRQRFPTIVGIEIYQQRLGPVQEKLPKPDGDREQQAATFLRGMVEQGLRAQVRSSNLLTGQLYVALDYVPTAPKVTFDTRVRPLTIPTIPSSFDHLQEQLANIIGKVDKLPLDSIARHLDATLAGLDKTVQQVNEQVLPETTQALQQAHKTLVTLQGLMVGDAPIPQALGQTLQEVKRAAVTFRVLTDLLSRHPESLLRGRPDDQPTPRPLSVSQESSQ
nr:MlaD family protein [Pseudomonas syringae]